MSCTSEQSALPKMSSRDNDLSQAVCMPACTRLSKEIQCEHTHALWSKPDGSYAHMCEHVHSIGAPEICPRAQNRETQCDMLRRTAGSQLRAVEQMERDIGYIRWWATNKAEPVCMPACMRLQEGMQCKHKHTVVRAASGSYVSTCEHSHYAVMAPVAAEHTSQEQKNTTQMDNPNDEGETTPLAEESPLLAVIRLERSLAHVRRQIELLQG